MTSIIAIPHSSLTVHQDKHSSLNNTMFNQTNAQGLYSLLIGTGTIQSGNFPIIGWGQNQHYLKVEIDPNGGNNFVQVGTPALLASVPYALEAQHADIANQADWANQANSATETTLQGDVEGNSQNNTVTKI